MVDFLNVVLWQGKASLTIINLIRLKMKCTKNGRTYIDYALKDRAGHVIMVNCSVAPKEPFQFLAGATMDGCSCLLLLEEACHNHQDVAVQLLLVEMNNICLALLHIVSPTTTTILPLILQCKGQVDTLKPLSKKGILCYFTLIW